MLFGGRRNEVFDEQRAAAYHCFSGAFADKPNLEEGDKVLLPSSAFEQLARLQIEYPMLFELRSAKGRAPRAGDPRLRPAPKTAPPRPQAHALRHLPAASPAAPATAPRGAATAPRRRYNDKRFYLEVQEVDFDAPVGYTEPDYASRSRATSEASSMPDLPAPLKALSAAKEAEAKAKAEGNFKSFAGAGSRLDGKDLKSAQAALLEKMPQQPPERIQQGLAVARHVVRGRRGREARAGAAGGGAAPPKPVFRKPNTSKWAKTNKAAFSGPATRAATTALGR
ncbi:ubiquitin fusion degradation protein [Aureococcus anophagefferens]|uniref:Ubiquitin fusion degradation protein n=1 Tax=Aureococcus anophagefferens TaxID=44056 RepID=A0ABR1FYI8_AURAN